MLLNAHAYTGLALSWGVRHHSYSVLKQAAEVLTSADLASKTHLPRAPRAAAAKAGAAIAAIGSGQTLVISQPGEDNSSGRVSRHERQGRGSVGS